MILGPAAHFGERLLVGADRSPPAPSIRLLAARGPSSWWPPTPTPSDHPLQPLRPGAPRGLSPPTEVVTAWQTGADPGQALPCHHRRLATSVTCGGLCPRSPLVPTGGSICRTPRSSSGPGQGPGAGSDLVEKAVVDRRDFAELERRAWGFSDAACSRSLEAVDPFPAARSGSWRRRGAGSPRPGPRRRCRGGGPPLLRSRKSATSLLLSPGTSTWGRRRRPPGARQRTPGMALRPSTTSARRRRNSSSMAVTPSLGLPGRHAGQRTKLAVQEVTLVCRRVRAGTRPAGRRTPGASRSQGLGEAVQDHGALGHPRQGGATLWCSPR